MSSKRQEFLIKATTAHAQAVSLRQNAQNVHDEYVLLRRNIDPQIFALLRKADPLAVEFRRIYAEAREAYVNDEKDRAAALKEEGYLIELECRRLNNEANALRKECDDVYKKYKALFKKADQFDMQANKYRAEADNLRQTAIKGFTNDSIFTDEEIEKFLDSMPQKFFCNIEEVRYIDKWRFENEGLVEGEIFNNKPSMNAVVEIYCHEGPKRIKRTIAHEIGHVAYTQFMSDSERQQFARLEWYHIKNNDPITFYAIKNTKESFCECFAIYRVESERLENYNLEIYKFIKNIYERNQ